MHRGAVTQDFADAGGDFRRIIANANNRIGSELRRVRQHLLKGIIARPLAQRGIERNIAAKQTLQTGSDVSNNGPGPDNDPSHHAE